MTQRKLSDRRSFRVNECRHFTGMMQETCAAGCVYKVIARYNEEGNGWGLRLPCLYDIAAEYPCPHLDRKTDEEVADEERRHKERIAFFIKSMPIAREAIVVDIGKDRKRQFVTGSIPCPICETGTLSYRYSGHYNGHIHASCNTKGCVSWME